MTQPLEPTTEVQYAEPPRPARPSTRPIYRPATAPVHAPATPRPQNRPVTPPKPQTPPKAPQTPPVTTARPRQEPPAEPVEPEKQLPHDLTMEAGVLGSMIIDPTVIDPVLQLIDKDEIFFKEENRIVFRCIRSLRDKQTPIDAMIIHRTLANEGTLEMAGGIEYLKVLANSVPFSSHALHYAVAIKEAWMKRRLISTFTQGLADAYESSGAASEVIARSEAAIFELNDLKVRTPTEKISVILNDMFDTLDHGATEIGLPTGFIELDEMILGMVRGDMIVIGARPSVGKTAFGLNVVEHLAVRLKKPCAIFTLEMSKHQMTQRLLCSMAAVNSHKLRRGTLSPQEKLDLSRTVAELSNVEIYIDDTPGMTLQDLRAKARRLKKMHDIQFIMVDYLQLMETGGKRYENRQVEVGNISRGIKQLAKELDIPILALSQLNRSSETENRRPRSSDLRESGSVENDASIIMLLHREAALHHGDEEWARINPNEANVAELILTKNREGPCGLVKLTFIGQRTRIGTYNPGV